MRQLYGVGFRLLGTGPVSGSLPRGTDQFPITGLQRPIITSQVIGFGRKRFGLLVLALMQPDLRQIIPDASVARLNA